VTANILVVLEENNGRNHGHSKVTSDTLRILLGIDGNPLLDLVRKLLLHILQRRLDDLTGSTGRRPEMENNYTTHSIFSTVT
jgi:hypothetical protein